jgi:hypothetical protein
MLDPVQEGGNMGVSHLAEAIILQSIEDLWNELHREDCKTFFNGGGFSICARIAGMGLSDKEKLLSMIGGLIKYKKIPVKNPRRKNCKCIFC